MERKSFDLTEKELADAKRRAAEAGVSLNRYIRLAVIEKNANQSVVQDLAEMRANVDQMISKMAEQTTTLRADMTDDVAQAMDAVRQENVAFINRQQELLKQFLLTLGQQLTAKPIAPAGFPPNMRPLGGQQ